MEKEYKAPFQRKEVERIDFGKQWSSNLKDISGTSTKKTIQKLDSRKGELLVENTVLVGKYDVCSVNRRHPLNNIKHAYYSSVNVLHN